MDLNEKDPIGVGYVAGWVQLVKLWIPDAWKRWLPLVAIACGILYAFTLNSGRGWAVTIMAGATTGLAAAGGFSAVRKLAGGDVKDDAPAPAPTVTPPAPTP